MMLLAHHLEAHHVPVLAAIFAAGFFLGWLAISRWLARGVRASGNAAEAAEPRS